MSSLPLPFDDGQSGGPVPSEVEGPVPSNVEGRLEALDSAGRARAVDPRFNVALEASAGTGKTRVLVDRYINLLRAGVDPSNILAITFTRKAAAEMRERILATLRLAAARGEIAPSRWRELRDRTADVGISTIDAFCLSLLREFPLEADLDPGFSIADETEVPRLIDEALDRALRRCRSLARREDDLAMAFAQLGERRLRLGLATLLSRRLVAPRALDRYLAAGPGDLDADAAGSRTAADLVALLESGPGGLQGFVDSGPAAPSFVLLTHGLRALEDHVSRRQRLEPGRLQAVFARVREHFLTQDGQPRVRSPFSKAAYPRERLRDWERQRTLVVRHAPQANVILQGYRRDLNVIVSRGIRQMFAMAEAEYRRTLERHAVLDFSDLLLRALTLLRQMEEFSRSRYRLESRYHHVLVDEFQDTSRAQWELVSLLMQAWGSGVGLAYEGPLPPSIFIVGDRKQSIYGFRDADVSVLRDAAQFLDGLRPDGGVRQSIARSFRSVPALLSFINDVCQDIDKAPDRRDAFEYGERDRFPVATTAAGAPVVGLLAAETPEACAALTAGEIARLLAAATTVRDKETGVARVMRAGDVAILFRTRESHREFELALEARHIRSYVYKGLGFFDSDEIKDVLALMWYLADPVSDLRAAAFLRSRFVRLSDAALQTLAPHLADALLGDREPDAIGALEPDDRRALADARDETRRWRGLVDRLPPAELLDVALRETAYGVELRGPRRAQAHENLKKMRALVRRIQNRGYATLARIAAYLDRLAVGDDSNAVIDAADAVQLMTVHAAKGLEFPIVFVVNLARGTGNRRDPVRLASDASGELTSVAVGDFQADADADAAAREREESKRLLYVALTRARDRLYLGTVLKDGQVQAGRGSLAEVMPRTLLDLFVPGLAGSVTPWTSSSGSVHRLLRAGAPDPMASAGEPALLAPLAPAFSIDDFGPLLDNAETRLTVADALEVEHGDTVERGTASDRLLGTAVHRLVQRFGFGAEPGAGALRRLLPALLEPDGAAELPIDWHERVLAAYRTIAEDAELTRVLEQGRPLHEVPFTMRADGRLIRGTIDCLVHAGDGRITVLEFKTGRSRPEHEQQLALYCRAARQLFPGATVEGRIIYAS